VNPSAAAVFIYLIAEHLINGLILSAGIFIGAAVLLPLIFQEKRWSAATRHGVALLTFVVLAATPLLVVLKPSSPAQSSEIRPAQIMIETETDGHTITARPAPNDLVQTWNQPVMVQSKAGDVFPSLFHSRWLTKVSWPTLLVAVWGVFTGFCLIRLVVACRWLFILHQSAQPIGLGQHLVTSRPIVIAESQLVSSPVAVGLWSPKILLPLRFRSEFSSDDQQKVLQHEIAHLERFDDWSTLTQQLLLAFFPINPFLWIMNRLLQLQQESASDDWVLAEIRQPRSYANLLARLAEIHPQHSVLAAGVSRQGRQLYQRLARILDATRNRAKRPSAQNLAMAATGLLGTCLAGIIWLPGVAWAPVARGDEPPKTAVATMPARPALDSEIIAVLKDSTLNDGDPRVRQEAVFALTDHDGDDVTTALLAILNESKDEQVKLSILHRLGPKRLTDARIKDKLADLAVNEASIPVRIMALRLLSRKADEATVAKFISIYRSTSEPGVKEASLYGLGNAESRSAKEFLISIGKQDPDPEMRRTALRAIAKQPEPGWELAMEGGPEGFDRVPPGPGPGEHRALVLLSGNDFDLPRLRDGRDELMVRRLPGRLFERDQNELGHFPPPFDDDHHQPPGSTPEPGLSPSPGPGVSPSPGLSPRTNQ
jgi:beta-lactamase regulating signal transducer with metallopeptidase domain